jgi:hypothetical protein
MARIPISGPVTQPPIESTAFRCAAITNNAGAIVNFNDTSIAATATLTNAGTVNFNNSATAGNANITNNNAAFLNFHNSSIAGSTAITNTAGGTTQFLDSSTAGNAVITNLVNGIAQFFTTSTAGNATINNNGGLTQFNNSSSAGNAVTTTNSGGGVFFVGTSSGGQATFITNSGGVFDISGLTSAGTTAGSIAGAGNYFLGSKTLAVGGNNLSTTVSGVISDGGLSGGIGGSLTKVGSGTLTLETYTGATAVNGGTLVVDGSTALSSLTTVNPGAVLAGSGTVGNTAIAGGTLAPGSAGGSVFGPLTVQGNLSFTAASTYMIQVSSTNAGLTNVTGSATLGGATVDAVFTGTLQKQYKILAATGGVSGTFNPAIVSNTSNVQSTLSYEANDVFLNINVSFTPSGGTLSVNQQNVANAITGFFNATGSLPATFGALNAAGLTTASGELGTGVIQSSIKADDLFLNLLLDPTVAGRAGGFAAPGGDASAYADKRRATPGERDAYAMVTKAPRFAAEANPLGGVGRGLWRFRDSRRQRPGRIAGPQSKRAWPGRRRRLQGLAGHPCRLRARRRRHRLLACQWARHRFGRPVPGRCLRKAQLRSDLSRRRAGLWLARCHHQPHRGAGRRRPVAGTFQGRHLFGPVRGRLPLRDAVGRNYALRGGAGDQLPPAGLCRADACRGRPVRAELRRANHDRHPNRDRPARR